MNKKIWASLLDGVKTTAADLVEGFTEIAHSSIAILGLSVLVAGGVLATQPEIRAEGETALRAWLQERQDAAADVTVTGITITPELTAIERATASNPANLPKEQAKVAYWIAKKYKVAPEPLAALVAEAYDIGSQTRIEPTLLLAIMAIESSFNPFAQSPVGAQGLMQVMTTIHSDKYENYGGMHAAFDPRSNLRVGAQVLHECIQRAGSLRGGLKHYVGAANLATDGGYGDKVMREFQDMYRVAKGKPLPGNFDLTPRMLTAQAKPSGGLSERAAERAQALSYVNPVRPESARLASAQTLSGDLAVREQ